MVAAAEVAVWGRARPGAVRAGDGEESLVGRVVAGTAAVAGAKARRVEGGAWASKAACSEARAARARENGVEECEQMESGAHSRHP